MSTNKVAVVTACFLMDETRMDECSKDFIANSEWDYILFTNDKSKFECSSTWQVREIDCSRFKNGVYAAKYVKWKTYKYIPDYDVVIWVDSFIVPNMERIEEINKIINCVKNKETLIYIPKHNFKNINDNIEWCVNNKRIHREMGKNVIAHLDKVENFSVHGSHTTYWSMGMIKHNNSTKLKKLTDHLYELVETIGYRDQFWLPALFKRYDVVPKTINNQEEKIFIEAGKHIFENHNYVDFIK